MPTTFTYVPSFLLPISKYRYGYFAYHYRGKLYNKTINCSYVRKYAYLQGTFTPLIINTKHKHNRL